MGTGKNKLQKFAEFDAFENTFDFRHQTKGKWSEIFKNQNPIVLELACGKGDYTLGMAKMYPEKNFIGVDIKGNRLWKGAKTAIEKNLHNVRFLRIPIDKITEYFEMNEVSEIWITFPDPQPHKETKRLSSGRFLNRYRQIMASTGKMKVKTDSTLFYQSTLEQIAEDNLIIFKNIDDIYSMENVPEILTIKTFYENIWLKIGKKIKYLEFELGNCVSRETKKKNSADFTFLKDIESESTISTKRL
jgi:tRNA (guanine-N7-)-methyltransferase